MAITPLCFFKSLDFLGPVSLIGVVAVVVVVVVLVSTSINSTVKPPLDNLVAFNLQPCAIQSLPIIFFALMCHLTIVPCGIELGEYWPSLRSSSQPHNDGGTHNNDANTANDANDANDTNDANTETKATATLMDSKEGNNAAATTPLIKPRFRTLIVMTAMVMTTCWLMYSAVGASGYLLFGASTKANVINSFGKTIQGGSGNEPVTVMVVVSQVCMALSTLLGYPTMLYIARQTLFELVGEMEHGGKSYILTTMAMQFTMLALALAIRWLGLDIGFVISLIGSTAGASLQFILPACMLYTLGMPCKGCLFMLFGIVFALLGTTITILGAVCESKATGEMKWCGVLGFTS